MKVFLTSNPFVYGRETGLNPENDFIWNIKYSLSYENNVLFVAAMPLDHQVNDRMSAQIKDCFNSSGIFVKSMDVLDSRYVERANELDKYDMIILSGGHVPTQNEFLMSLDFKNKLKHYDGTVLGISAGSMNSAGTVYAIPEEDGEGTDPSFKRFIDGLDLTDINIVPHFDSLPQRTVDGMNMLGVVKRDSKSRKFLGLPDGSYVSINDGRELVYGPFYTVADGVATKTEASFMAQAFQ